MRAERRDSEPIWKESVVVKEDHSAWSLIEEVTWLRDAQDADATERENTVCREE